MYLFLLFLIVPLIEIALFIVVGGGIGLLPTLLIVVFTAILGTVMVRTQGLGVLAQLRQSADTLNDPTEPLVHGAMILFSGALLLTPGFFTDAVGFGLLIPRVRALLFDLLKSRIQGAASAEGRAGARSPTEPELIDAEYEDVEAPKSSGTSGWTRH